MFKNVIAFVEDCMSAVFNLEKIETITVSELEQILLLQKGATMGSIITYTDATGAKTVKGQKAAKTVSKIQIELGSDYTTKVQKNSEEKDFQAMESPYISLGGYLLTDKSTQTKKYLKYIVNHNAKVESLYVDAFDGRIIEKTSEHFTPSAFVEKQTAGRGTVSEDKNFQYRVVKLENILNLNIKGKQYIIKH